MKLTWISCGCGVTRRVRPDSNAAKHGGSWRACRSCRLRSSIRKHRDAIAKLQLQLEARTEKGL